MSVCDGCSHDNIFRKWRQKDMAHQLMWLCTDCRRRLDGLEPLPEREMAWYVLPLARLVAGTVVVVSVVLAVGAHW